MLNGRTMRKLSRFIHSLSPNILSSMARQSMLIMYLSRSRACWDHTSADVLSTKMPYLFWWSAVSWSDWPEV